MKKVAFYDSVEIRADTKWKMKTEREIMKEKLNLHARKRRTYRMENVELEVEELCSWLIICKWSTNVLYEVKKRRTTTKIFLLFQFFFGFCSFGYAMIHVIWLKKRGMKYEKFLIAISLLFCSHSRSFCWFNSFSIEYRRTLDFNRFRSQTFSNVEKSFFYFFSSL